MRAFLAGLTLVAAACGGGSSASPPESAPAPDTRPLSSLAAERVLVTPTFAVRVAPDLGWSSTAARSRELLQAMDADIASALEARGLRRTWVLPPELMASYKRNPTYAPDPYALAEEPLRAPSLAKGTRLAEPLASQLRTMIALHENARLVLAPVELRIERITSSTSAGRATLRLALLDPRFSEARWVGEVKSDTASAFTPAMTATLAQRLVDLVLPRF